MRRSIQKHRLRAGGAIAAVTALLLSGVGASAASAADAGLNTDAYAADGGEQITSAGEFLYDPRKGDGPEDAYQLTYRSALDLTAIWAEYQSLRGMGVLIFGEQGWRNSTFAGAWNFSFTLDPEVVSVDESMLTCDSIAADFAVQNAGGSAPEILQCTDVAYDAAARTLTIGLSMQLADGGAVTGAHLDQAATEPPTVLLATPAGALYVAQSAFAAGATFELADSSASGRMTLNHPIGASFPVEFSTSAVPAPLQMVPTYETEYSFVSGTAGKTLPQSVVELLPEPEIMLRNGAEVAPTALETVEVPDGDGTWAFEGWQPASATIADANAQFVGTWAYDGEDGGGVTPEETYGVSYSFQAANAVGDGPLPDEVLGLLPSSSAQYEPGATVVPDSPSQTSVVFTEDDHEAGIRTVTTWSFLGWDAESVTVVDSDVVFTGLWGKTVTEEPIVTPPGDTFTARYAFVAADGVEDPLPDEVQQLLPEPSTGHVTGEFVQAAELAATEVVITVDDEDAQTRTVATWTFEGWFFDTLEVGESDIQFTGSWNQLVDTEPLPGAGDGGAGDGDGPAPGENGDPTPGDPGAGASGSTGPGETTSTLTETGGASPMMLAGAAVLLLAAGVALAVRRARRQAHELD